MQSIFSEVNEAIMVFYRIIFIYFLLFIPAHTWAADSAQFKAYKKYIKETRRCPDVACYRSVIMRRGSEYAINILNKSADEFVQKTYELEKKKAIKRRKRGSIYVVEEIIEGDKAILRLSSKTYRALNETIHLVMEEGKWKIGKASKKKEPDKEAEANTVKKRSN